MKYYELPEPIIIGEVDPQALEKNEASYLRTNDQETLWGLEEPSKENDAVLNVFGHLAADLRKNQDIPDHKSVLLRRVHGRTSMASPGEPFIAIGQTWHADDLVRHDYEVMVHTESPTQYLAGRALKEDVDTLLGLNPDTEKLSSRNIIDLGYIIAKRPDNDNGFPDLNISQPVRYAAHLLTTQHLHRSPPNSSDHNVTRDQYTLMFQVTDHQ